MTVELSVASSASSVGVVSEQASNHDGAPTATRYVCIVIFLIKKNDYEQQHTNRQTKTTHPQPPRTEARAARSTAQLMLARWRARATASEAGTCTTHP